MALDRLIKVDGGGISTTSDYRVGVITATKFVGPIEGVVTGTLTGTATTAVNAQGLIGTPDITVRNIKATGLSTFVGDAQFDGNVSIAGTLTYEDVTNIDSVGLITARDGIFVPDNKKLELGNAAGSGDLQIFHDSSNSYIENSTNSLFIRSDSLQLYKKSSSERYIVCASDAAVKLFYDNDLKLETSTKGIKVGTGVTIETNGQATFVGIVTFGSGSTTIDNNVVNVGTALTLGHTQGVQFHTQNLHAQGFEINQINASGIITASSFRGPTGGTATFQDIDVDGHTNLDNVSIAGVTTFVGNVNIANDTGKIQLGASQDLQFYHDFSGGSENSHIRQTTNKHLQITAYTTFNRISGTWGVIKDSNSHNIIRATAGSDVKLYFNNGEKLATTNTGINITGTVVATGADINGDLDVDGHTNLDNVSIAGVTTFAQKINLSDNFIRNCRGFNSGNEQARIVVKAGDNSAGGGLRIVEYYNDDTTLFSSEIANFYTTGIELKENVSITGDLTIPDSIVHDGDTDTKIYFDNNTIKFDTAGSERLRIDSGGSISIGDAATHTYSAHSEGDDLVIGGAGWRGMTIYGEGGGGVIQFADNADNRVGQIMYNHGDNSMMFRTNGNVDRLTISSSGMVQIGGAIGNNADIDTTNTRLTIKQSANNREDGIYLERTGERRGWLMFVGGALGQNDAFCLSTNQIGTKTDVVSIDRGGDIKVSSSLVTQSVSGAAAILRTEATANDGDALIQADGRDSSGNLRRIMMRTDAGADQYGIISSDTTYNLALCTGNAPRVLIAGNSAATSIGGSNVFNAMLTVQGDISGQLLNLKATENTTRLMVSGTDSNGCAINLYDDAGAQKGILETTSTHFNIMAPGQTSMSFKTNDGYGTVERAAIDKYGTLKAHGFRRNSGTSNYNYTPLKGGYQGDDLFVGPTSFYQIGHKNSSPSSNYSAHELTMYRSGHWGQYTQCIVYAIQFYYTHGVRIWHIDSGGTITLKHDYGGNTNITSGGQQLVGSGTHSGQNVYKYQITFENGGTYQQVKWFVGHIGGGSNGHIGNSKTVSEADSWFQTRGGGIHLPNLAHESMQGSPFYQY